MSWSVAAQTARRGRTLWSEQDRGEFAVAGHRVSAGSVEDLDGNVVGTRIKVSYEPGPDFFRGAVKDQRVNEAVASITGHIIGCETVAEEGVDIVTQLEVWPRDERAPDSA